MYVRACVGVFCLFEKGAGRVTVMKTTQLSFTLYMFCSLSSTMEVALGYVLKTQVILPFGESTFGWDMF